MLLWQLHHKTGACTLLIFVGMLVLRLFLLMNTPGHVGVDGGAYLMHANTVMGAVNWGIDNATRPPLSPGWFLVPFVQLLGYELGYKLFQAVAGLPLIVAAYLLYRRVLPSPAMPVVALALLAFDFVHAEMAVTGMVPLLSFAFVTLAVLALIELAERWSWRYAALLAGSIPMIAHTNLTAAGVALVVLPVVVLALCLPRNPALAGRFLVRLAIPAAAGVTLAATALPWFLGSAPGDGKLRYDGPLFYFNAQEPGAWILAIIVWTATYFGLRFGPAPIKVLAITSAWMAFLQLWLSWDEAVINVLVRSRFFLTVFLWPVAVWAAARFVVPRVGPPLRAPLVAACVFAMAALFAQSYQAQAAYSSFASPDYSAAMAYQRERSTGGLVITNSYAHAHWVTALSSNTIDTRWTFTNPAPPRWEQDDEHVRCVLGWVPECDVAGAVRALNVEHVIIDERYPQAFNQRLHGEPYHGTPELWAFTAGRPWLVEVFRQGHAAVYEVVAR